MDGASSLAPLRLNGRPSPQVFSAARSPVIFMRGARAAYFGPGLQLPPHRNAVATIAIGLDAPFRLQCDGKEIPAECRECSFAIIRPKAWHYLETSGAMIFLYLDAMSADYAALQRFPSANWAASLKKLELSSETLAAIAPNQLAKTLAAVWQCLGLGSDLPSDTRLMDCLRAIDAQPEEFADVASAAQLVGLSASRFQHVFTAVTGIPFRRYRLWRRMAAAIRAYGGGMSLTEAAYAAGFSSSAHLSSSFRTLFGVTPTMLRAAGIRIDCV